MLLHGLGRLATSDHDVITENTTIPLLFLRVVYFLLPMLLPALDARSPHVQLRAEVKSIDNKLTTTSMKLVEEKTLLRRKDSIKARLKELVVFESSLQEVQVLKVGRHFLSTRVRIIYDCFRTCVAEHTRTTYL